MIVIISTISHRSECNIESLKTWKLFNFEGNNVRTLEIDEEVYFVGKDVAKVLGYARLQKAVNDHVDPEDKIEKIVNISQSSQNRTKPENLNKPEYFHSGYLLNLFQYVQLKHLYYLSHG